MVADAESPRGATRAVTCGGYSRPMTVPTRGARARRSGRRPGWLLLTVLLVLAIVASSALVFTNRVELLKLAVILALWAAVVAAFVSVIYRRQSDVDQAKVRDLKMVYDLQLDREISARREYELTVETHLRRELSTEMRARPPTRWLRCGPNWLRCERTWRFCSTPTSPPTRHRDRARARHVPAGWPAADRHRCRPRQRPHRGEPDHRRAGRTSPGNRMVAVHGGAHRRSIRGRRHQRAPGMAAAIAGRRAPRRRGTPPLSRRVPPDNGRRAAGRPHPRRQSRRHPSGRPTRRRRLEPHADRRLGSAPQPPTATDPPPIAQNGSTSGERRSGAGPAEPAHATRRGRARPGRAEGTRTAADPGPSRKCRRPPPPPTVGAAGRADRVTAVPTRAATGGQSVGESAGPVATPVPPTAAGADAARSELTF